MPDVTEVEKTLLLVLRAFVDDDIELEDNFYTKGGDSIIALRVVAAAQEHGLDIGLADLLLQPTVGELAGVLAAAAESVADEPLAGPDSAAPIDLPAGVADRWQASALQSGLIYLCEMAADNPGLYHDFLGIRVAADFVEPLFRSALHGVCRRHAALRSSFDLASYDSAAQLIWFDIDDPLTVESSAAERDADDLVAHWRSRRLAEGFDWASAPLFRCHVVAGPDWFRLTIGIHHSIIDGWSFARLLVDLLSLYDAELAGRPARLAPAPSAGHREFRALEHAAAESADSARFWQEQADARPLLFARPRFAGSADPSAERALPLHPGRAAALRRAAAAAGVPLKSLLLAVHGWALGRWVGRAHDVVTGLVVNGRPEIEGSDLLVGLFLNTVPLRLRSVTGPLRELAAQALAAEQHAMPHRRYPLARIEHTLGRPAFDVSFNFTHFHVYRELADLRRVRVDGWWAYDRASFPLLVNFVVDAPEFGTGVQIAFDPTMVAYERIDVLTALLDEGLDLAVEAE
ncbi:condensation domain-containing protein [Nocardia sp. NPDC060256]|uniref:condensation domain-containing protein n=1 Tax=unclassified Nocardia TaxID=2637762 RepID=UPI00364867B8